MLTQEQLNHIPTIPATGLFSTRLGSLKTLIHGHEMMQEGYQKVTSD
jgi:hypothetical protein